MSPKKKPKYVTAKEEYLAAIAEGLGPEAAAAKTGASLNELHALRELPETVRAEGQALGQIEGKLFEEASKGKIPAMIFWLCNRDPQRWKTVTSIGRGDDGGGLSELEKAIREIQDK